jgi:hypothetical protein
VLLVRRFNGARSFRARLTIITTAPETQSQVNVMKLSFALIYARAVLVLACPSVGVLPSSTR